MSYFVVDVESDHQSPSVGSMVCFGVVKVADLSKTFYGEVKPIMHTFDPQALSISGFTREQHEEFGDPFEVMLELKDWLDKNSEGKPTFISDNPAFDFQWINFYFWKYLGMNPFGFSGRRIGDLYCGLVKHAGKNNEWKRKFRKTKHDHNPVNDAMGNAEALLEMKKMGLNITF